MKSTSSEMVWNVPLTDDQFMMIGKITTSLSMVELTIDTLMMMASGSMSIYRQSIMTGSAPISAKNDMLFKMVQWSIPDPHCSEIRRACAKLRPFLKTRNRIIHGQWGVTKSGNGNVVGAFSLNAPGDLFAAEQIPEALKEIGEISIAFMTAVDNLMGRKTKSPYTLNFSVHSPKLPPNEDKQQDFAARIHADIMGRRRE